MKRKVFAVLMSMVMFASVLPSTVNAEGCTHENSYDVDAKEPTCEEWGHKGYDKCMDCEEWLTEVEWIDALGHNYENDICSRCGKEACKHLSFYVEKGKAPTCEEAGWTDYRYCGDCGETLQESEHCSVCGEVFAAQEEIPAFGHEFVDNACTNEGCEAKIAVDADTEEDSITKEEVTEDIKEVTVVENEKTNEAVSNIKTETLNVVTTIVAGEKAADKLVEDGVISKETKEAIQKAVDNGEVVETVISVEMLDVQDVSADVAAKITITIAIPKELISENGKYVVVREHEGVTELLEATVNEDGTISFVTDRFSTYALGFVSTKTEIGSGTEAGSESGAGSVEESSSDNVPKTGDSSNIILLMTVMMMSIFVFASVIIRRKKDN